MKQFKNNKTRDKKAKYYLDSFVRVEMVWKMECIHYTCFMMLTIFFGKSVLNFATNLNNGVGKM